MSDPAPTVPFTRAARVIFDVSLEAMLWSRRSLLMACLLGLPILLSVIFRLVLGARLATGVGSPDLYGILVAFYYVRNVLPLAALFYATSLVADEVESKTLTYLLTRPIPRNAILAGKFLAYLTTTVCLTLPAAIISFFLLATAPGAMGIRAGAGDLVRDLGVMVLTLLVYGALFTFAGVLLKRPLIPGLLFLFIWELLANLRGYMPRLTVTAYVRSLLRHRPAQEGLSELFGQVLPAALCLQVLAVMTLVFLAAAGWIFSRREYVMEQ
jgi:ABC-type transport system involved in multi-copper enzyme maturation permease subunit